MDGSRDTYAQVNRATWNAWSATDTGSEHFKDGERFRATGSSLRSIELAELDEVRGKTLLHLQCNMGADTLSWARRGARVTGVDISEKAIARALEMASQTATEARLIATDVYALPDTLHEQFDIVYTSYGALWWLEDLEGWARIAASYVRPGGRFYIVDMHPSTNCLEVDPTSSAAEPRLSVVAPYAHPAEPLELLRRQPDVPVRTWTYGLGEVVTALLRAGLRPVFLHEHFVQFYQQFPLLVRGEDGWWRWPPEARGLPLLFSLLAERPDSPSA